MPLVSELDPLDPVVFRVNDVDATLTVDGQRPRVGELARPPTGTAPHTQRDAGRRELLQAMVPALDHIQVPFRSECHVVRVFELTRTGPLGPDHANELAGRLEGLNAVVTRVGDVEQPVRPEGQG